jgi:hypothetical protein
MVHRSVAFGLAFVAACLMVTAVQAKAAKEKPAHGTVVSITSGKLIVNVKADKTDKVGMEKTYDVSPNVSVTVDGKPGKIEDIAQNDKITFKLDADGKVVTDISKGKKPKKTT